eukprot:748882-Hanusia_phi.AAC.1
MISIPKFGAQRQLACKDIHWAYFIIRYAIGVTRFNGSEGPGLSLAVAPGRAPGARLAGRPGARGPPGPGVGPDYGTPSYCPTSPPRSDGQSLGDRAPAGLCRSVLPRRYGTGGTGVGAMSGEAAAMLPRLKAAINGGDMDGAKKLMIQLKILMTSFKSTPGVVAANEANVQELMIVREFYELGCLVAAQSEDIEGFERHFAVVKSCYTDYSAVLPQSEKQYELQGLNLLCLLSQSKIAEFHTELELIPYLMEGSYQKVLESPGGVPSKSYSYFVRLLSGTVRDSIAESSEAAYDWMPLAQALKMLSMESAKELAEYAVSKQREWEVDVNANVVRFREDQKVDLEVSPWICDSCSDHSGSRFPVRD